MLQKPDYHRQTAKFIAMISECMPEIPADVMQKWIHNPKELKAALGRALYPKSVQKILIDTDAYPSVPEGWIIVEHRKGGQLKWNIENVSLFLSLKQNSGYIVGHDLRKELADKPVLNACVMDYLIANPHLIPEEWKGKFIFFWGTIYRDPDGVLCVRYLYWDIGRWYCFYRLLDNNWQSYNPALLSNVEEI